MMMSTPSMIVCAVLLAGLLFAEDAAADWAANALDTDRNGPILFPSERILMAMSNKTETNNTSTAPTHMVTGVDGVARQFEIGIDPCHNEPDGPQLQCMLFTLCEPDTIRTQDNGMVYTGNDDTKDCKGFSVACCLPDAKRIEEYNKRQPLYDAEIQLANQSKPPSGKTGSRNM